MPDDDRLLIEAIDHARDVRLTCGNADCAEDHRQLAEWLWELYIRRQHKPLRCKLGFHNYTIKPETAGTGRLCNLCGHTWFGGYP